MPVRLLVAASLATTLAGCTAAPPDASPNSSASAGRSSPATTACAALWSMTEVPLPSRYPQTITGEGGAPGIEAMAAATSRDIWVVGASASAGSDVTARAFSAHWDGSSWTQVPVAHQGAESSPPDAENLDGVYASSTSDAWAVGYYPVTPPNANSPEERTLVEHWDGTAWSVVAAPDASASDELTAVSGTGPSDVWAVGYATNSIAQLFSADAPLVEHWAGTSWSVVPAPSPATTQSYAAQHPDSSSNPTSVRLTGVDAVGPNDVWAVGYIAHTYTAASDQTFAEHWNGTAWSVQSVPDVTVAETGQPADDKLDGVAATGSSDVWSVGAALPVGALAVHWDGSAWRTVPTPADDSAFSAVAAVAPDDVWAAGGELEHWNGQAWTRTPTINGAPATATAIAAVSAGDVWFGSRAQVIHYRCT